MSAFNSQAIRNQFPILNQAAAPVIYLDSAASSQKPTVVIEAIRQYYMTSHANVHRGIYRLAEQATAAYEGAREISARFLNSTSPSEIIFTSGTTQAINLVAASWGGRFFKPGDEILLTVAEHHSNIVPWQLIAERTGAVVKFIPLNDEYRLDLNAAAKLVNAKTKVIAFAHVSNVLGVVHPVKALVELARNVGAITVIDGAQAAAHVPIDVQALGCDFYAFSGHKVVGPTGIGVLWGKADRLAAMPPYQGGGEMIESVTLAGSTWKPAPQRFEAGTPHIAGAVGLGAALTFLMQLDRKAALAHDVGLGRRVLKGLKEFAHVKAFTDEGDDWVGIVSFHHAHIHPHDIAAILDSRGVCVRAGHHCAQPLMNVLGIPASSRVSPYIYNTADDIDGFIEALREAERVLQ